MFKELKEFFSTKPEPKDISPPIVQLLEALDSDRDRFWLEVDLPRDGVNYSVKDTATGLEIVVNGRLRMMPRGVSDSWYAVSPGWLTHDEVVALGTKLKHIQDTVSLEWQKRDNLARKRLLDKERASYTAKYNDLEKNS